MSLGGARQGPLAPEACQLGKNDVLTTTGTPGSETSKLTVSSVLLILLTVTAGSGFFARLRAWVGPAWAQSAGPLSTSGRSSAVRSTNHWAQGCSHSLCGTPVSTTRPVRKR